VNQARIENRLADLDRRIKVLEGMALEQFPGDTRILDAEAPADNTDSE